MTAFDKADVRVGDVLKAEHSAWPKGSFLHGEVYDFGGADSLYLCGWQVATFDRDYWTITVVSQAKRAFYVNVSRDPIKGDVFRDAEDDTDTGTYSPSSHDGFWENIEGNTITLADLPKTRRLLIDGETGQVVS